MVEFAPQSASKKFHIVLHWVNMVLIGHDFAEKVVLDFLYNSLHGPNVNGMVNKFSGLVV